MTLLQMSIQAALMIAVISLIRFTAIHRLPKKTFVILWGIVVLRLILPFSIPSPFSIYTQLARHISVQEYEALEYLPSFPYDDQQTATSINPYPSSARPAEQAQITGSTDTVSIPPVSFLSEDTPTEIICSDRGQFLQKQLLPHLPTFIWAAGMLLLALFFTNTYLRCLRRFSTSFPINCEYIHSWHTSHPLKRRYSIRKTDCIHSALTYGIIHPVILLPKHTDWNDINTLHYILLHEYMHIRHFDALFKLLLTAVLCLHWFNPFVWLLYLLANRDLELACDESVLLAFSSDGRMSYAMTLIHMEEQKATKFPLYNAFSQTFIEERIKAIMKTRKTTIPAILVAILLTTTITGAFATSASNTPADIPDETTLEISSSDNQSILIRISDSAVIEIPSVSEDELNTYLTQIEAVDYSKWYLKEEAEWHSYDILTSDSDFAFIHDFSTDYSALYESLGTDYADITLEELTKRIANFIYYNEETAIHIAFRRNIHPSESPFTLIEGSETLLEDEDLGIIIGQGFSAAINLLKSDAGLETPDKIFFIDNTHRANLYTASADYNELQEIYRVTRPFSYYVNDPSQLTVREFSDRLIEVLEAMKLYWIRLGTSRLLFMDEQDILEALSSITNQYSDELITFTAADAAIFEKEISGSNELALEPDFETIKISYDNKTYLTVSNIFRRAELFRALKTLDLNPAKADRQYPAFNDDSSYTRFTLNEHTFIIGDDFLVADNIAYQIDAESAESIVKILNRAYSVDQ